MRKPKQHKHFEISQLRGVSTVLAGRDRTDEAIVHTDVDELDVLPAGPSNVPNPTEILGSKAFSKLLAQLRTRYDCILVDSPPVGPVTDACILATLCDGTLLVVRPEKATLKSIQFSKDAILKVNSRLLGVILNGVTDKRNRYGAYYYRGSGLGYGNHPYYRKPKKPQDVELNKAMMEIPLKEYSEDGSLNDRSASIQIMDDKRISV